MWKHQVLLIVISLMSMGMLTAQKQSVVVEVHGLACPYCAYGLEKQFKELEGATDIRIDVEKGLLFFSLDKKAELTTREIKKYVKQAGFTAKSVSISKDKKPDEQGPN